MITVPACESCNNRKSTVDSYFRDALTCDIRVQDHPVAKSIISGPVLRSARRNSSSVMRVVKDAVPVPIILESGICGGFAYAADLDGEAIYDALSYIIRGLHYHIEKKALKRAERIRAQAVIGEQLDEVNEWWLEHGYYRRLTLGDGIFDCAYNRWPDGASWTIWFFEFYRSIHFYAITGTPPRNHPL